MKQLTNNMNPLVSLLLAALYLVCPAILAAPYDTPDYYLCSNRVGGEWNFGRVPSACDVDPWGDPAYVADNFLPLIFDDNVTRSSERQRYMLELHAMLRDSVEYYMLARKPAATAAEVAAWQRANFAKAHQETFWTHYRDATDGNIKMVRGDYGHGHGMVQIDDRWHFPRLEEGKGWHIFENIIYGMELFYDAWEDAGTASCVSSPDNWRSRARSAYSVYNGGASKICRWTDPNDVWAQNDIGYVDKYDTQTWLNYVSDAAHETTLDIPCFMEGNPGCTATESVDADDPANWPGRQINLASGEACRFEDNAFDCVADAMDMACLNIQYGATSGGSLSPSASATNVYSKNVQEKHACFSGAVTGLSTVGQAVRSEIAITVRGTPGGSSLGFATQAGKVYQVLDYVVNDLNAQYRYYLVSENDQQGYIYAGEVADHSSWTTVAAHSALTEVLIPQADDQIAVAAASGINLRDVPAGTLLNTVPSGEVLGVLSTVVQGVDNDVYYEVDYAGDTGFIYGGKVLNGMTLPDWVVYTETPVEPLYPNTGNVIEIVSSFGINLRDAPGGNYLVTVPSGSLLYVFSTTIQGTDDYVYYEVTYDGQHGYIYGGQLAGTSTLDSWAVLSSTSVAHAGDQVELVIGINQRTTPGGSLIQTIPADTVLTVLSTVVQGDDNYVYYEVSYNGSTGYIYSGYLTPASTLSSWTMIAE